MIKVTVYDDDLQQERTFQGEGAIVAVRDDAATEIFVGGYMSDDELTMLACKATAGAVKAIQSMQGEGK